jgi:diguanylate cyclase (GGDEF)-like protein
MAPLRRESQQYERDPLTGVYSRLHLNESLQALIDTSITIEKPFSLLMLDIDHFKSINDAYGHPRGDLVLVEFARRLPAVLGDQNLAFRYGGDEFVILLPGMGKEDASALALRLLEAVQVAEFTGDPPLSLSLSIGVATCPQDGADPEALFFSADRYHYEAKRAGRGRVAGELAADTSSPFESPSLIERVPELAELRRYLSGLSQGGDWCLTLSGPTGAGKSRLLAEAARLARLEGMMTLHLAGSLANAQRLHGALAEVLKDIGDQPHSPLVFNCLAKSLASWLETKGKSGLLFLLDDPHLVDPETLAWLPRLRQALSGWPVGLLSTQAAGQPHPQALAGLPPLPELALQPLSHQGMRAWLQASLHWEPPGELVAWLHTQTGGWPGTLRRGLQLLVEQGALYESGDGWHCLADLTELPLSEWLAMPPVKANFLPAQISTIVGRDAELWAVKQLVQISRLVTLYGPGGIGKTRLALQVGLERLPLHADGAALVTCDALQEPSGAAHQIAEVIGLQFSGNQEINEQLLRYLAQKDLLLILDNLDPQSAVVALIGQILDSASQVRLLVTARDRLRLGVPGEALFEVHSLPCPAPGQEPEEAGASMLFIHYARQIEPDFTVTTADGETLARICQLLEGMPLALELAASWVATHTLDEIAAEIEKGVGFLSSDRADLPERHRSLVAVFDSFWAMLSPVEQGILAKLSVFNGGFTGNAAQQVAGASPFFLDALARRAFLRKANPSYYVMHELLRRYAADRLSADPEAERQARMQHCHYYMATLERHRDEIAKGTIPGEWLSFERQNLRLAWEWAVSHALGDELRRGMYGFYSYHQLSGNFKLGELAFGEAITQVEAALQAVSDPLLTPVLAYLLIRRAGYLNKLGQFEEALQAARRGVALGEELGDHAMQAEGLLECGDALRHQGDFRAAAEVLKQGLTLAETLALPILQVDCLYALGAVSHYLGDLPTQRHYAEQALAISTAHEDRRGEGRAYNLLAIVAEMDGDYAQARLYYQRSIQICRAAGDRRGESIPLVNLGALLQLLGSYSAAGNVYEQFLQIKRDTSDRQGEIWGLNYLSLLAHQSGNQAAALAYAGQALAIAVELGDHNNEGNALTNLGHALLATGELAAASDAYEQALVLRREREQTRLAMETIAGLSRLRLSQSNPAEALALVEEILAYLENNSLDGTDDPFRVWLTCYEVLCANEDIRGLAILERAHQELQARASRIGESDLQHSFLENVVTHRELVNAWQMHQQHQVSP